MKRENDCTNCEEFTRCKVCRNCKHEDVKQADEPCIECMGETCCWEPKGRRSRPTPKTKVQFEYVVTHPTLWLTPEEMSVIQGKMCRVTIEEVEE